MGVRTLIYIYCSIPSSLIPLHWSKCSKYKIRLAIFPALKTLINKNKVILSVNTDHHCAVIRLWILSSCAWNYIFVLFYTTKYKRRILMFEWMQNYHKQWINSLSKCMSITLLKCSDQHCIHKWQYMSATWGRIKKKGHCYFSLSAGPWSQTISF